MDEGDAGEGSEQYGLGCAVFQIHWKILRTVKSTTLTFMYSSSMHNG